MTPDDTFLELVLIKMVTKLVFSYLFSASVVEEVSPIGICLHTLEDKHLSEAEPHDFVRDVKPSFVRRVE